MADTVAPPRPITGGLAAPPPPVTIRRRRRLWPFWLVGSIAVIVIGSQLEGGFP